MSDHPRIGCFIYNDSTFWSMLAHGVTTRAAEFGATVEVLSARDVEGQDAILAQMIAQRVDAMVVGVIDPERGAQRPRRGPSRHPSHRGGGRAARLSRQVDDSDRRYRRRAARS